MEINNLIYDLIVEEIKNKKLFEFLLNKWFGQNPTDEQKEKTEKLYNRFSEIQNGLSTKRPQVISFLTRFDGNHGYPLFKPEFIKDIKQYSLQQITSLIDEYTDDEVVVPNQDVFSGKDTSPTTEKIDASKNMWFSPESAIVNEDGFRVYDIKDQKMSVRYGYYVEQINKNIPGSNFPWCVTWRQDQNRTNMWGNYRSQGRSFYFVIDESKPTSDRYYLSALQRDTNTRDGYVLTSVKNDGDQPMPWDSIVAIYPKLSNYKDLISVKQYSTDELQEKNIVGQINENPGSPYEFRRLERQLKRAYINNQGTLKRPESWQSMDEKLRELYISVTTQGSIVDRFSNYEFVNEVKKVGSDFTLLDNKVKALGKQSGVGYILDHLMQREFKVARTSLDNKNIRMYESKQTNKFGLYNSKKLSWVEKNGITYDPLYSEVDVSAYFDEEGNAYIVETFSKSNEINNESFFCIFPQDGSSTSGHFLSFSAWNKLKEKLSPDDDMTLTDFDKESDIDIKEMYK